MKVRIGWRPEDEKKKKNLPEFAEVPDDTPEEDVSGVLKEQFGVEPRGWAQMEDV